MNGRPVMLNCDLIESIEESPDSAPDDAETIITLTTGNVVVVREPMAEIEGKVVAFKQSIYAARHRDG
jgi:uncharacterized protein YlzI (FlbEa/FlbD family)